MGGTKLIKLAKVAYKCLLFPY